jgi:hypothetical protein
MTETPEPEWSVEPLHEGSDTLRVTAKITVADRTWTHYVQVHVDSKPFASAEKTYGEMTAEEIINSEWHSFSEWEERALAEAAAHALQLAGATNNG